MPFANISFSGCFCLFVFCFTMMSQVFPTLYVAWNCSFPGLFSTIQIQKVRFHVPLLDFVVAPVFLTKFSPFFPFVCKEFAITSDEALSLEELPKRAVILGGGFVLSLVSVFKYYILGSEMLMIANGYPLFYLGTLPSSLLQYGVGWVLLWIYASERNFH